MVQTERVMSRKTSSTPERESDQKPDQRPDHERAAPHPLSSHQRRQVAWYLGALRPWSAEITQAWHEDRLLRSAGSRLTRPLRAPPSCRHGAQIATQAWAKLAQQSPDLAKAMRDLQPEVLRELGDLDAILSHWDQR